MPLSRMGPYDSRQALGKSGEIVDSYVVGAVFFMVVYVDVYVRVFG